MSNQTSNQSQSQTSSSVQSSIPRFGSSTSEPAHSFGLPNSLASAPCMWPIAFAGNSRAQDTKDNNKQLALRMNCNNSVYHNGTSTEKRQLMSAQFNSVSRNRNTSLQKSPSDHITPNTTGNLSHFESKLSAESSRNSHLPLFGISTLSTANRAKSLPNSRHNLSYIPGSQPIDVDETDLTLSHSNLPLRFGIADHSKHNIIGKTQQANLKMSQPTKTTTHPMGLIKSQSLKFESNRNNSNAVIFVSPKVKGEASKSLETVETVDNLDIYSKLPRTLTSSSNAIISKMASGLKDEYECMFDEQTSTSNNQTRGSLSRSSTASLGVLSNLNDILPDDYCDVDTIEMNARLAAIDELISPMPSLNPISAKESIFKCPSTDFIESNDKQPDILSHNPDKLENMHSSEINSLADTISETEVISLNSIDMVETKGDVDIQSQETNSKSNKCKTTNIKSSKAFVKPTGSVASHLPSKIQTSISSTNRLANLSRLAAPKSTRIATNNKNKSTLTSNLGIKNTITSNKRMDFNMNRKASSNKSSLPSSSNGSRISTPTPSEMEFGDHDSIGSTASSTVSLTKAISSKLTYQQSNVTNRRLTQRVLATNTKPITNEANKSKIKSIPTKQDYVPGATISRSSTYTRYLNNATNNFVSKGPENRSKILSTNGSEQAMKLKTNLRNESKGTFKVRSRAYPHEPTIMFDHISCELEEK
ncbi:hypothetical protein BLOT_000702 [Blomia tropicalis]|nr:hypothetical protein BLOT_000702 [Blomia tropicalis]